MFLLLLLLLSVLRIEKNAKFDAPVGLLGRVSRTGSNYDSLEETQ